VFGKILETKDDGTSQEKPRKDKLPHNINFLPQREVTKSLFMYNFIPFITAMVRSECFDEVGLMDEDIKGGADDYEICLRIANKYKIKYIDELLAIHRIHKTNYSNEERFFYDNIAIANKMVQQIPYLTNLAMKKQSISCFNLGRFYQLNKEFHLAKKMFIKSIKNYSFQTKSLVAILLCSLGPLGNSLSKSFSLIQKRLNLNK
jgi:GT2 family glycosyltransferase